MFHVGFGFLAVILFLTSLSHASYSPDPRRGHPGEYDPGPEKGSNFAKLFGSTPNYRAIGQHILGGRGEKFRWIFGPMWYRGRLGKNQVKGFGVGQEGAQDENVSNRAFTGSTGTKTQKFLNHLGLTDQYVIMNTFVYTINGQLDPENPKFKWMEQGAEPNAESPIVEYRHSLFDEMVRQNPDTLQLVLGVGSGGKASVVTWINARGGNCSTANNIRSCDTTRVNAYFQSKGIPLKHKLLIVGVPHPGGASPSNGGLTALKAIVAGFTDAAKRVANEIRTNQTFSDAWFNGLRESKEAVLKRLNTDFKYGDAPIPFKDFTYATNWRMGAQGTTSNRREADSIQIFSSLGKYNNTGHTVTYRRESDQLATLIKLGNALRVPGMLDIDIPYEMPKFERSEPDHVNQYDYGPCGNTQPSCALSKALQSWPDFDSLGSAPRNHETFGHGPTYRGRFADARLIILADQESHDDLFSTRAITGETGQRLQRWLEVTGLGDRYVILRTLPVDTLGMAPADAQTIALHEKVVAARNKIFAEAAKAGAAMKVVTLGEVAVEVAKSIEGIEVIGNLPSPGNNHGKLWNDAAVKTAKAIGTQVDGTYSATKLTSIARSDLPSHTRWWMGSTGTRASRGDGNDEVNGNYYKVYAPLWVGKLAPKPLSDAEKKVIDDRMVAADLRGRAAGEAKVTEFIHRDYNQDDKTTQSFKRVATDEDEWDYIADPVLSRQLKTTGISVQDVEAAELQGRANNTPIFKDPAAQGDVIENAAQEVDG